MKSSISAILNELTNNTVEHMDVQKIKYEWHDVSRIEPPMGACDYVALLEDIKLMGRIHTPIILYEQKIVDGRHRQKACIELGFTLPIIELKGEYTKSQLKEVVRSIHMNRNKTKIQKDIQAFKYKQNVAGITWESACTRYGTKVRSIKSINTLYNLLEKNACDDDFDKVLQRFELGMNITPKQFRWIDKATGTFSGAIRQFNEFIGQLEVTDEDIDITEKEKVLNRETLEFELVDRTKDDNAFIVEGMSKEDLEKEVMLLRKRVKELESKLKT